MPEAENSSSFVLTLTAEQDWDPQLLSHVELHVGSQLRSANALWFFYHVKVKGVLGNMDVSAPFLSVHLMGEIYFTKEGICGVRS